MVIVIGAGRGIGKLSAFRVANKDTHRESIRSMLEQVILAYGGVGNIIITPGWIVGIRDTAVS